MSGWFDAAAELPGLRGVAVHVLPAGRETEVRRVLEGAGFSIRVLEGRKAATEASFFEEVARTLRLPGPFGHNWDALQDALGDLARGEDRRVALLWRDADRSFAGDAQTVVDAFVAFSRAADDLAAEEAATQLEVFLLGESPAFVRP
jgi:RNAse (barnase) inhibitor barstar